MKNNQTKTKCNCGCDCDKCKEKTFENECINEIEHKDQARLIFD